MKRVIKYLALLVLPSAMSAEESWPQFRGPGGLASIENAAELPLEWSDEKNLRWKVELPGPGSSSPVFVGDRLFITCYVGYGTDPRDPGNPEDLGRQLLCFNRETSELLWKRPVGLENPEDDYRGYIMEHGYASSTPATDGKAVYAFFGKSGVHAFGLDGEPLWSREVGKRSANRRWGSGASPVLHEDLVIVNAADEGRALIAFDKKSGEERWRKESDKLELAYGTPVIRKAEDGKAELVMAMPHAIWGLDPLTGKSRWDVGTEMPGNICPSVVIGDGMLFAFGGYPRKSSTAIKDGEIVWVGKSTTYVPTPLAHDSRLYWVNDDAEAICMDAKTGDVITKNKVEGLTGSKKRSFYASIVRVGDKLIAVSRRSGVFVFDANSEMKQVGHNTFKDESDFNATPALATDAIYLRSNRFLYAIGAPSE